MSNNIPVSFLVLTKNEQQDLPRCLASASQFQEIIVFDSFSTDATLDVAKQFGAKVVQREFDNWSAHQNWGLQNIPFECQWVYYSDADEVLPEALVDELAQLVQSPGDSVAFRMPRRDYFMGKWLKHVIPSPFNIRFFRPDKIHYERLTNPVTVPDGPVGQMKQHFDHYPFSKGMTHWIAKHNSYSSHEAEQIHLNRREAIKPSLTYALFGKDVYQRRVHQKEIFYRLPCRPLSKFLILYVLKRGFLDGVPGFTYAALQSIYEYMIVLKTKELALKAQGKTV